jgi:sialic acid synthase SpsE
MVEKHFTITPGEGGDHDFAIGPEDLARLVTSDVPVSEGVRAVYSGTPTLGVLGCEAEARHLARRSIHAKVDIPPGAQITRVMLTVIRPATGLAPWLLEAVKGQIGADFSPVGKLANVAIAAGTPITPNLFGGVRFNLTVE